jgi:hypothetical protein
MLQQQKAKRCRTAIDAMQEEAEIYAKQAKTMPQLSVASEDEETAKKGVGVLASFGNGGDRT